MKTVLGILVVLIFVLLFISGKRVQDDQDHFYEEQHKRLDKIQDSLECLINRNDILIARSAKKDPPESAMQSCIRCHGRNSTDAPEIIQTRPPKKFLRDSPYIWDTTDERPTRDRKTPD